MKTSHARIVNEGVPTMTDELFTSDECPDCGSDEIRTEYLFARENLDDVTCECLECGKTWDVIVTKEINESEPA